VAWKQKQHNKDKEISLKSQGRHQLLARILAQKSVEENDLDKFLSTEYKDLNHPHKLHDVEKAAKIFLDHVKNESRVGVIGDYDADGIVSSTMLHELCREFDLPCKVFLPSRLEHGYGLSAKTIKSFKEKMKSPPELLFVTDCGTNNRAEIEELKEFGIKDIIVIDHHLPGAEENISRNASALISWHFSEDFNEMCACGEVFQLIRGIRWLTKHVDPIEFLSYAAIGTIADSSPIVGDNRIVVKNGLTQYALDHVCASGLNALIKAKMRLSTGLTQTDIGFRIAPMINASGRIETPDVVFKLLTEYDNTIAKEMAGKVLKLNEERKALQGFIEKGAVAKATSLNCKSGILVADKDWHIGIVGIVASRVVEELGKPALVIGYHNGVWKGSGRSVIGVNVKEILDTCSHIFDAYGGHAAAVGVTLKDEYVDQAAEIFDKACEEYYQNNEMASEHFKEYEAALKIKAVSEEVATVLKDNLAPYCNEHNSEPVFKLKDVKVTNPQIREGKGWRLMTLNVYKGEELLEHPLKMFSPKFGDEIEGQMVDVYFTFPQHWDNSQRYEKFDLTVVDIVQK
jgi:single-stranded-DNA-specific exonuclease